MWCWGRNISWQLGNGTTVETETAIPVQAISSAATDIASGYYHNCAIVNQGLWCWGSNSHGEVSGGTTSERSAPLQVTALGNQVKDIVLGHGFSCAQLLDNSISCWGANDTGQLGRGTISPYESAPQVIAALGTDNAELSLGADHACVRKNNGTLWCWGSGGQGRLGNSLTANQPTPVEVTAAGADVASVAAGRAHTCVRKQSGAVHCWGWGIYGQLGDTFSTNSLTPVQVANIGNSATQLSVGHTHSCVLSGSNPYCWGENASGQLGDGGDTNAPAPVTIPNVSTADKIRAGRAQTCAIAADGTTRCWGVLAGSVRPAFTVPGLCPAP